MFFNLSISLTDSTIVPRLKFNCKLYSCIPLFFKHLSLLISLGVTWFLTLGGAASYVDLSLLPAWREKWCFYSPVVILNIVNIDGLVLWLRVLILPGVFIQNFHFHTCSSGSFIHLCSCVVCHCINRLSLIYPFSCWWACRLSWGFFAITTSVNILINDSLYVCMRDSLGTYTQEWNSFVIADIYLQT